MALSSHDYKTIQSLVSANVDKTFSGLNRFIKRNAWLGKNNGYTIDTVKKILTEVRAGGIRAGGQLSQYIAASCFLHCADGWSYLGKSLFALLRGDPHRSRHFSYYAELRGAMALLATQGIGVFDKKHVVIDGPNSVESLRGEYGTHQFAWDCLNLWSTQPQSGILFAKIVRPNGRSLDDWLAPVGGSNAIAPQAERWFQQWGMDLRWGLEDRNARNESSYRPDGLPAVWNIEANDVLKLVHGIWSLLEPTVDSRFDVIDKHILRIAIEAYFRGTRGSAPTASSAKYRQLVDGILNDQDFSVEMKQWWSNFLTRNTFKQDPEIFGLSAQPPKFQGASYAGIVARATLLLRIASGAASELFNSSGLDGKSTEFWWNRLGVARGLWEGSKNSDELLDLWSDVDLLLKDVEEFQQRYGAEDQSFLRIGQELSHVAVGLGSLEKVAIWGMTPS